MAAFGVQEDGVTRNRPYAFVDVTRALSHQCDTTATVEGAVRTYYDAASNTGGADVRALNYQYLSARQCLVVGFQEICWGETFGVFIADIVNPRDYTDPLLNDPDWFQRSVCAINWQYFYGPWTLQLVATPIPTSMLLPRKGDPFFALPQQIGDTPIKPLPGRHALKDAEGGCRIERLLNCGFDVSAFYYFHWNRNPVYAYKVSDTELVLQPLSERVHSCGVTFTKACEDLVFRGDAVYHFDQPWNNIAFGFPETMGVAQLILGVDNIGAEGFSWGLQYHIDAWEGAVLESLSLQACKAFDRHRLQAFFYKGLNTQDMWFQPQYVFMPNPHLSISLRADLVAGTDLRHNMRDGFLGPLAGKDRILLWVSYCR